jgi:hypothetical protein
LELAALGLEAGDAEVERAVLAVVRWLDVHPLAADITLPHHI